MKNLMNLSKEEISLVIELLRQEEHRYEDNSIPYVTQSTSRELSIIKLRVRLERKVKKDERDNSVSR